MQLKFKNPFHNKSLFCIVFLVMTGGRSMAQLPSCVGANANIIYFISGGTIYNYDVTQPVSATNPIANTIPAPPAVANSGLSLGPNLNAAGPSPTFYIVGAGVGTYYYYNGASWINTGFLPAPAGVPAFNIGGGGNYIYGLVASGDVYRYDGTGNGTLLTTVTGFNSDGPNDVTADCSGNFYILKTVSPAALYEYSSAGTLINTFTVTGAPNVGNGGGLALINNNIYYNQGTNIYAGSIVGSAINVTTLATGFSPTPTDFASCPSSTTGSNITRKDSVYVCSGSTGTSITAPGTAPYVWTVLSGPAVITGSGLMVSVTAAANSVILSQATSTVCNLLFDTIKIIVPTAVVDAGLPKNITGCGSFADTLNGLLTDTTAGLTYNLNWTPALAIASGGNTLHPIVHPVAQTTYTLTATTPFNQGGCTFFDTVQIGIINKIVKATFTDSVRAGCTADTNYFINQSLAQTRQAWDFGDNTAKDTTLNPVHIYTSQGTHSVLLTVDNGVCVDSVRQTVDPPHPVKASFTVSADTICQGQTITFTNTSTGATPTYSWSFGDGGTDNATTPNYTYLNEGVFLVKLVEKDVASCLDSTAMTVTVDSISAVNFTTSDSVLCQGKAVTFAGAYISNGYTGNTWDFGDGTVINDANPIVHGYATPGVYQVSLKATFAVCRDTMIKKNISVFAYPAINIGTDTSMCPNGNPMLLTDAVNAGNPAAKWLWNTGDTAATILATQPGVYYATVSLNGCSNSDSVWIKNDCYLSIPNSFTPNNDGINDYFIPRQKLSEGLIFFHMRIFNRWGQIVFETKNIDGRGWDGKFNSADQPDGVYVYTIDTEFKNGDVEAYKGNVTLLR